MNSRKSGLFFVLVVFAFMDMDATLSAANRFSVPFFLYVDLYALKIFPLRVSAYPVVLCSACIPSFSSMLGVDPQAANVVCELEAQTHDRQTFQDPYSTRYGVQPKSSFHSRHKWEMNIGYVDRLL